MKHCLSWLYIFCAFLIFIGCGNPAQESTPVSPRVRTAFRSSGTNTIKATVFVEGPDGNVVSGAVVTVKDNRNIMAQLGYDAGSGSYTGLLEEFPGESNYTVEVSSILSGDIISLSIPYAKSEITPNVTVFQDAAGNSVLSGQSVLSNQSIQIGWADCGEGVVYQIAVRTSLKNVYTVSSNACTVTLPAGTIPTGAYSLEITAQKIFGDVYYRSLPYYSASSVNAPMVSFYVN